MTELKVTHQRIDDAQIIRVYSGRPGCGCGCRGRYWPNEEKAAPTANDQRQIERIKKILHSRIDEVYVSPGIGRDIFVIEDDQRYFWAYT